MAKSQVLSNPEAKSSTINPIPTRDEIALRAHEIFLERGSVAGHDVDDWLQAELELTLRGINGGSTKIAASDSRETQANSTGVSPAAATLWPPSVHARKVQKALRLDKIFRSNGVSR